MQVHGCRPGDVGAGARRRPGCAGDAVGDAGAHQFMVGRVKLHQVDPVALAIMAAEYRQVVVGLEAGLHQRVASQRPVGGQFIVCPGALVLPHPVLQRQVAAVQVDTVQRRHLVGDFVGFRVLMQVHGAILRCLLLSSAEIGHPAV